MNRRRPYLGLALLSLVALLAAALNGAAGTSLAAGTAGRATPRVADGVRAALTNTGSARVIVMLRDPVAIGSALPPRARAVAQSQADVLGQLPAQSFRLLHRYTHVPALAGVVTPQGLAALEQHGLVESVGLDETGTVHLAQSVAALGADVVHASYGLTGQGVTVAVLDTGVNTAHPDLSGAIVAQQCFTAGNCPPLNTNTGTSAQDQNGHGTHVAGIIASRGNVGSVGFAPDVQIVAVRVLDSGGAGFVSDWVAGLDWVRTNQAALHIRIVNMSLGTFALYQGACDAQEPALANVVAQLVAAGVAIFASTGNQGSTNRLAAPACNSGVIGVGATYDGNVGREPDAGTYSTMFGPSWPGCFDAATSLPTITCFTNSSAAMDLVAPGAPITAPGLGSGLATYWGTSQASPTAAGIAALMLQAQPALTPAAIETTLKTTGSAVTDPKNGLSFPLVNALSAVNSLRSYAVTAVPNTPAQTAAPGTLVTYTVRVTNAGNVSDTFDLSLSTPNWSESAPGSIGPLLAGASADIQVLVRIPLTASGGQSDRMTATLRSRGNPAAVADVVLTTTVAQNIAFLPVIQR